MMIMACRGCKKKREKFQKLVEQQRQKIVKQQIKSSENNKKPK